MYPPTTYFLSSFPHFGRECDRESSGLEHWVTHWTIQTLLNVFLGHPIRAEKYFYTPISGVIAAVKLIKSKQIKLIGRSVLFGWRRLVIDVSSGLGQLSWTVITLTDMIAALREAVRILALPDTLVLWSLSPLNWPGGAKKQLLPLLIIDYWPASAESSVQSFYIRPDSSSSPCADSRCRVGGGGLFAGRRTALCLCSADVCWNALLEESLVIHGCSEGEDWPQYSHTQQSFRCALRCPEEADCKVHRCWPVLVRFQRTCWNGGCTHPTGGCCSIVAHYTIGR